MRYLLFTLIFPFFACETKNEYPVGGFEYPKQVEVTDTNLYYYPLKNIESKKDAFYDTYTYLFYQAFDEPNLSIRPQAKETFRLTYSTAFGFSVIISLTNDSIIVKKGYPNDMYSEDTSHLSETEKFHLKLLKLRYPIESFDTAGKRPRVKHYLDSLVKLYPQLVDPSYFHNLYEKTIVRNTDKFTYPIIKFSLKSQQFDSLIRQINSSGFWTMSYRNDCNDPPFDGDAFTFEANTRKKYKIVSVGRCPGDTSKFTKACQKLIELAKMDNEINLIGINRTITLDSLELQNIKKQ